MLRKFFAIFGLILFGFEAGAAPGLLPFQGRVFDSFGNPITSTVTVSFRIFSPSSTTCYLYEDTQSVTPDNLGLFSVLLGTAGNSTGPANNFLEVFNDNPAAPLTDSCANPYSPTANDYRQIQIVVNGFTLPDIQTIASAPFALQAGALQGKLASDFIQVEGNVVQANMDTLTGGGDATSLHNHDSRYAQLNTSNSFNGSITSSGSIFATSAASSIGVGTSTPAADIDIVKVSPTMRFDMQLGGGGNGSIQFYSGATLRAAIQSSAATSQLIFSTGGTTALTLDAAQNATFVANVSAPTMGATTMSTQSLRVFEPTNTFDANIKVPASLAANYTLTLPGGLPGSNGSVLTSDTLGNLTWTTPVASVTGSAPIVITGLATAPIVNVSNATTAAVGVVQLAASGGVTAGTVVQATDARLNDSRAPTGAASGDLSGNYPNPTVAQIQGTAVSGAAPVNGQFLRFTSVGANWQAAYIDLNDLKSTVAGNLFSAPNCSAAQTLSWSAVNDQFSCIGIAIATAGQAGLMQVGSGLSVAAGTVSLSTTGVSAGTYNSVTVDTFGRVAAGTNPTSLAGYGILDAVGNDGGAPSVQEGLDGAKPAASIPGRLYVATDTFIIYRDNGVSWDLFSDGAALGTVQSVNLAMPNIFSVSGSPITLSGTITSSLVNQTANAVFAGPGSGAAATPTFRALVPLDIPNLDWSKITTGTPTTVAGYGITDAVKNAGGTPSIQEGLAAAQPAPGNAGSIYIATDTLVIFRDTGASWVVVAQAGGAAGGDLSGTLPNPTVAKIDGTAISAAPISAGQFLVFDGTAHYVPTALSGDATMAASGAVTLKNTGTAGSYFQVTTDAQGRVTVGANPTTLNGFGITDGIKNSGGTPSIQEGVLAARPAPGTAGNIYLSTDNFVIYRDNGASWDFIASAGSGSTVINVAGNAPLSVTNPTVSPVISISQAGAAQDGYLSQADWNTFNNKQSATLSNGEILVGDGLNVTTPVTPGGDVTMTNAGLFTVGAIQGKTVAVTAPTDAQMYLFNNGASKWEPVSMSGDATITNAGAVTLKSTGTAGSYYKVTTDAQGRVTAGNATLGTGDLPTLAPADIWVGSGASVATPVAPSGDVTMNNAGAFTVGALQGKTVSLTAPTDAQLLFYNNGTSTWTPITVGGDATVTNAGAVTLKNTGTAGTYFKVTTDAQGRVTAGTNPTTLAGYGITDPIFVNGGNSFGGAASLGTADNNVLNIKTNGSTALTIDTSQNVGIGTSTPGSALDVKGTFRLEGSTSGFSALKSPAVAGSVTWTLPGGDGSNGTVLSTDGAGNLAWINPAIDSVTSVGLAMPGIFNVSNSPVTSTGTLTATLANENANLVFAGPSSGGAAAPTFRSLAATDIPGLDWSKIISGTPTTLAGYGITDAVRNAGGTGTLQEGLAAALPAPGNAGNIYIATDTLVIFRDNGASWVMIAQASGSLPGGSATGDLSGTYPSPTVAKINGTTVSAAPSSGGQFLVFDGTSHYVPTALSGDATMVASGAVTLKNTGTAGSYFQVTTDAQGRVTAGANPTTLSGFGITNAVTNNGGAGGMQEGLAAALPAPGNAGNIYIATDTKVVFRDNGASWDTIAQAGGTIPGGSAGGDLGGTYPNPSVAQIQGTAVSATAPSNAQLLFFNNGTGKWTPASVTGDATVTNAGAVSLKDTGTAGSYFQVTTDAQGRVSAGANPTTLTGFGITDAVKNAGGAGSMQEGLAAALPAPGNAGNIYIATDTKVVFRDNGASWDLIAQASGSLPGGSATGDLSGSYPNPTVAKINGTAISAAPSSGGQFLIFDGTAHYVPTAISGDATMVSSGAVTLKNTGTAGSYFQVTTDAQGRVTAGVNPTTISGFGITDAVKNAGGTGTVQEGLAAALPAPGTAGNIYIATDTKIIFRDNGVSWDVLAQAGGAAGGDLSGTYPNPSVAQIQGTAVSSTAPSNAQLLLFNNGTSKWTPGSLSGDATVTNAGAVTLKNIGTAGSYYQVTTDAQGRVTAGANPTTLTGFGITNAVTNNGGTPGMQEGLAAALPAAGNAGNVYIETDTKVILRDNGASWDVIAQASGSLPGGAAGGDLSGTYPNPAVAQIQGTAVSATAPSNAQLLFFNNGTSKWTPGSLSGDATVTNSGAVTLKNTGTSGSYYQVTTDGQGRVTAGANPTTLVGFGITDAVKNAGGTGTLQEGLAAALPAAGNVGNIFIATDTKTVFRDNGASWDVISSATGSGGTVTNVSGTGPISVATQTTTPVISIQQADATHDGFLAQADWTTFNNKLATALTSAQIWVGNGSNVATAVTPGGDVTMTNTGAITVASVGGSSAANIHTAELLVNAAGAVDSANEIVKRDPSGNFSATGATLTDVVLNDSQGTPNTATIQAPAAITTSYTLKLPIALGSLNQVLTTDAAGNLSWATPAANLPPSGAAGGDLGGTYPSPTVLSVADVTTGVLGFTNGGTGQATQGAAMDAIAGGNASGQYLRGNGAHVVLSAIQVADVPTLNQNTTGTAGNVTGNVAVVNGGTGQTTYTNGQILIGDTTGNTLVPATMTAGSGVSITNGTGSITIATTGAPPTGSATGDLGGNYPSPTVLSVADVTTGILGFTNGGTGQATQGAAMDAIAGGNASGQYLRGNGAHVVLSAIQVADVPTLNQNTTGTAGNVTGTVAVVNGGTGQTTYTNGQILIGDTTGNTLVPATMTAGSGVSITNGTGSITIATTGAPPTGSATGDLGGTYPSPTVLSVADVTTGILGFTNGGTGQATQGAAMDAIAGGNASGQYLRGNGVHVVLSAIQVADVPTLNQNTTGSAATATTATNATNVATSQTSTAASFFPLFVASSAGGNQAVDVGTGLSFNPSTNTLTTTNFVGALTGNATNVTGTVAVANGGTGQSSYTNGQILIGDTTGNTLVPATLTAGTGIAITNGTGSITIATTGAGPTGSAGGDLGSTYPNPTVLSVADVTTGTLAVANGGTGTSNGSITGTGALAFTASGASNNVTVTPGAGGFTLLSGGNVGIGMTPPTAVLQLKAGTATAGTAPLKLTAGTVLGTPEPGAIEYDGTSLFYTDSTNARHTLAAAGAGITALTGDVTATGAGSVSATVNSVNGVAYSAGPSTNTVPVVTSANTVTYEAIPNAALANNSLTIGSTSIALGASATTISGLATLNLGTNGTTAGLLSVANGTGGGAAVSIENPSTTTAYNFNLPATAGAPGQFLTSQGGVGTAMTWTTPTTGTVTSVSVNTSNGFAGTSSGGATPALTISTNVTGVLKGNGTAISAAASGSDYSAGTSALATGILKSTTATGALTIAVPADFPTLNQNTTGTAAGLSSTLAVTSGGTGQTSFTNGQLLIGDTTGNTLVPATLTAGSGVSITNGAGTITIATTGAAPTGAAGGDLGSTYPNPTVLSVADVTTGVLGFTNGGTGAATQGAAMDAIAGGNASGQYLRGNGAHVVLSAIQVADVPTLNQNTTGSAATATTATNATNVATTQSSTAASFFPLFVASSASGNQAVDVGTGLSFNPSTNTLTTTNFVGALTGNATNVTGTVAVANGGTGQTSYTNGQLLIGDTTGNTLVPATLTAGSGVSVTNGTGTITIATTGAAPTGAAGGDLGGNYPSPTVLSVADVTTGVLGFTNGGTGAATQGAAMDAIAGGVASGQYPRGNGAHVVMSTIQVADVPTLNQNTTGSAATATTATNATNVATTQTSTAASFFPLFVSTSATGNQAADVGTGLSFNPSTNTLTTTNFVGTLTGNATNVTGTIAVANGGTGQTSYTNGQILIGDTTGNTLVPATLTAGSGVSITNGAGTIAIATTGAAPTGAAGGDLGSTYPNPTVLSVADVTTGVLGFTNGGTGAATQGAAMDAIAGGNASGQYLRGNGAHVVLSAIQVADVPTLNQSTTGTAANVTGTVAVDHGGTGQTSYTNGQLLIGDTTGNTLVPATLTAGSGVSVTNGTGTITIATTGAAPTGAASGDLGGNYPSPTVLSVADVTTGVLGFTNGGTGAATQGAAMDAIAGGVASGQYPRGNGAHVVMSTIQVADVPTLNQNTTGSAATATTATNATNVATTQTSTAASFFPLFVSTSATGNQAADVGTGLTFNPSTNNLSTTTFTGALTGNATNVTGTVAVGHGGTGQTSYTNGQLLIGDTTGNTLVPATLTAGSGVTITNGTGAITIATTGAAPTGAAGGDLGSTYPNPTVLSVADVTTGILSVANGGTGIASGTAGGVPFYSASGTIASSGALTANQLVIGGGASGPSALAAGTNGQALIMSVGSPAYSSTIGGAVTLNMSFGATSTTSSTTIQSGSGGIIIDPASGNAVTVGDTGGAASSTLQSGTGGSTVSSSGVTTLSSSKVAAGAVTVESTGGTTSTTLITSNGTSATAVDVTATGAGGGITLSSGTGGSTVGSSGISTLSSSDVAAGAATVISTGGGASTTLVTSNGTGTAAVNITATAGTGGITLTSGSGGITLNPGSGALNFSTSGLQTISSSDVAAGAVTVETTGGGASTTLVTSNGTSATAVDITTTGAGGGITLASGTGGSTVGSSGISTLSSSDAAAGAATVTSTGGGASTTLITSNGTSSTAVDLTATGAGGGITLLSGTGGISETVNGTTGNVTLSAGTTSGTITIGNASTGTTLLGNTGAAGITTLQSIVDNIGNAATTTVNVGSAAAVAEVTTVGGTNTTSSTAIQSGTGGLTAEVTGTTGNVTVSAGTTSGTITIGNASTGTTLLGNTGAAGITTLQSIVDNIGNAATTTVNVGSAATIAEVTTLGSTNSTSSTIHQSGTGGSTVSSAGGLTTISSSDVAAGAVTVESTGGGAATTLVTSNGTTGAAVNLTATGVGGGITLTSGSGGITFNPGGGSITFVGGLNLGSASQQIFSSSDAVAGAVTVETTGGGAATTLLTSNGTSAAAVDITATGAGGGITLTSGSGGITLDPGSGNTVTIGDTGGGTTQLQSPTVDLGGASATTSINTLSTGLTTLNLGGTSTSNLTTTLGSTHGTSGTTVQSGSSGSTLSSSGITTVSSSDAAAGAVTVESTGGTTATTLITSNGTSATALDFTATGAGGGITLLSGTGGISETVNGTTGNVTLSAGTTSGTVTIGNASTGTTLLGNTGAAGITTLQSIVDNIGNAATTTVNVGSAATVAEVTTLGSTNTTSSTIHQSGTGGSTVSSSGVTTISSSDVAANAVTVESTGGTTATTLITSNGTGAAAVDITATAGTGGITLTSGSGGITLNPGSGALNFSTSGLETISSSDAAAGAVTIETTGGGAATTLLTSNGTSATAVDITATGAGGGITLASGTGGSTVGSSGISSLTSSDVAAGAATVSSTGGGASTTLITSNGTSATALDLTATGAGGGITLLSGTGGISETVNGTTGNVTVGAGTTSGTITIGNASTGTTLLGNTGAAGITTLQSIVDNIGNAATTTVNVGSAATVAEVTTVGGTNTTSSTAIQSGTGGLTAEVTGTTGNVTVSAGTTSGTITIGNASTGTTLLGNTGAAGITQIQSPSVKLGSAAGTTSITTTSTGLTTLNLGGFSTSALTTTLGGTNTTSASTVQSGTGGSTISSTGGLTTISSSDVAAGAVTVEATGGTTSTTLITSNGTGAAAVDITSTGAGSGITLAPNGAGTVTVTTSITAPAFFYSSDARLKHNIETIPDGLGGVLQLRGVTFNWNKDNSPEVGLIAQEVEKVYPQLVGTNAAGSKSVKYGNLVAPLIEAVKRLYDMVMDNQNATTELASKSSQQAAQISELNAKLQKLESDNQALRSEIQAIENKLQNGTN